MVVKPGHLNFNYWKRTIENERPAVQRVSCFIYLNGDLASSLLILEQFQLSVLPDLGGYPILLAESGVE